MKRWRWSDPPADRALGYALAECASLGVGALLFDLVRRASWNHGPAAMAGAVLMMFIVSATLSLLVAFAAISVFSALDSLASHRERAVAAYLSLALEVAVFGVVAAIYLS